MKNYLKILKHIKDDGDIKMDRTGVGTISCHAGQIRHQMSKGFPLLTTKKVSLKNIFLEWQWMFLGMTDVRWLQERGCTIWNEWATVSQCNKFERLVGDLGPVYGHQWRNFGASHAHTVMNPLWEVWRKELLKHPVDVNYDDMTEPYKYREEIIQKYIKSESRAFSPTCGRYRNLEKYIYGYLDDGFDQIIDLIRRLHKNPNDRRLLVTGWNPKEACDVALPPCHTLWQLHVSPKQHLNGDPSSTVNYLNLMLHQRSGDAFLGIPYNLAFYALTLQFFATMFDMAYGEVVLNIADAHIYLNHEDAVETQLKRTEFDLPKVVFSDQLRQKLKLVRDFIVDPDLENSDKDAKATFNELIANIEYGVDIQLLDYKHHDAIKADVAV